MTIALASGIMQLSSSATATTSSATTSSVRKSPWRFRGTAENVRTNKQRHIIRARRIQAAVLTAILLAITITFALWGGLEALAPLAPSIPLSLWLIWFGADTLRSDELAG